MKKPFITILASFLLPISLLASSEDFFRSIGKIYSVVAVVVVLFLAIIIYLVRMDNKLTKLEKQIKNES